MADSGKRLIVSLGVVSGMLLAFGLLVLLLEFAESGINSSIWQILVLW